MNLYVIQPGFDMLSTITSGVGKVCKSIGEWKEEDSMDCWIPPFILLHIAKGTPPHNALHLFDETGMMEGQQIGKR